MDFSAPHNNGGAYLDLCGYYTLNVTAGDETVGSIHTKIVPYDSFRTVYELYDDIDALAATDTDLYVAKESMGSGYTSMVLAVVTMFVGLFVIVALAHKKVKGAVLLGMLVASVIYWGGEAIFLHTNPFASLAGASFLPPFADMAKTTCSSWISADF